MKYIFTNILGEFIYDDTTQKIEKSKDNKQLEDLPKEKLSLVLEIFKDKKYFKEFYKENLKLSKESIKNSVSEDLLIIQAISNMGELDKINNILIKRLREWYALHFPEFEHLMNNQEKFVDSLIEKDREGLMIEFNINETMGADLAKLHLEEILLLAKEIKQLQLLRKKHENYLEKIMKKYCPNLLELGGITISAKLIELGRSVKHLAMLPASTIQLFGAEKALFRHLKTGARSPKYGIIYEHQLIQKAKKSLRGKIARVLADKLSLCARLDYFKGEFKAKEYKKDLERKFG